MYRQNKNNRDERAVLFSNNGLYKPLIKATTRMNLLRTAGKNEQRPSESMEINDIFKKERLEVSKAGYDATALSMGQPTIEQINAANMIRFKQD